MSCSRPREYRPIAAAQHGPRCSAGSASRYGARPPPPGDAIPPCGAAFVPMYESCTVTTTHTPCRKWFGLPGLPVRRRLPTGGVTKFRTYVTATPCPADERTHNPIHAADYVT